MTRPTNGAEPPSSTSAEGASRGERSARPRLLTASEIAKRFGVTRQAITYRLKRMYENGLVNRKDAGSNAVVRWVSDDDLEPSA